MFVNVKPFFFHSLVHTDADQFVYYLEQHEGHHRTEHHRNDRGRNLNPQLVPIPVKRTLHATFTGHELRGKNTGEHRPDDAAYPDRLRDLPDMPLVLYVTGESACLNSHRYVGMVGTRRPSAYGRQAAFDLSLEMAKQGAVIVSGLADGLDSEGHRAAVEAGTPTVAFLGTAIDTTYPAANVKLRQRIEKGGGAVCSEYPPGYQGKQKSTCLARNRLIAGLSEVLCVAEARIRSGTLNTVSHAESLGRPVLAVPGSIYSAQSQGTNELLRSGRAGVLCQAADVLACMGVESESAAPEQSAFAVEQTSPDAQAVYAALGPTPKGVDELAAATGLSASGVLAACTELELYGGAQSQPGRRYVAL